MPQPRKLSFFNKYGVTIVMIPSLIGIHYGWSLLQDNRILVPEEKQIELPIITFAKYTWRRMFDANAPKTVDEGTIAKSLPTVK